MGVARPRRADPLPIAPPPITSRRRFRSPDGRVVRLAFDGATGRVLTFEDDPLHGRGAGVSMPDGERTEGTAPLPGLAARWGRQEEVLDAARRASHDARHRSFTLIPSSYCNMGCDYCGQTHHPGGWSEAERHAVVRRVLAAVGDPRCESITVRWFGGEPLANYPGVVVVGSEIASACREAGKPLTGHMVTNGSLLTLDRLRTLATRCDVTTYEITIDGPAVVHDSRRLLKNGAGSYERILSVVAATLEEERLASVHFSLRTNIDRRNAPYVDDYLADLADRGLASDRVLINLQPVHDWSNDTSAIRLPIEEYARLEGGWMLRMYLHELRFGVLPVA